MPLDPDTLIAKFLALGVRNGVEDLHADGAFDDRQAPSFNRTVRRHIYEALLALTRVGEDDESIQAYLLDLVDDEVDDPLRSVMPAAVTNAIYEFAESADVDDETAEALVDASLEGLREYLDLFEAMTGSGAADERTQQMAALAFAMIPDYWEVPELSPEFRALL